MKKFIYLIVGGILIIICGLFGYFKFQENFGPVHGLVSYSNSRQELEDRINKNKEYISKKLIVEGKYSSNSDTLVLDNEAALQLVEIKSLNKVTQKLDNFKFETLEQIDNTPILWSKKNETTVSDEQNTTYSYPYGGYVVLGESSITSNILVLNKADFEKFKAPIEYVAVIKEKRAADEVLSNYHIPKQLPTQIFRID